ncbi:MBL fold metallo-hydrolase [Kiritimatiella glycovorans]|uniref:Metallo-beta-lactamase superfamily protein n=1 Tax=Kiritimatiella glycovorans TaxID=1307763 RepID=A0A0G3EGB5_9BACT|nr:MBL fold metallo-hydrolase [Kiritimatiella glycovorans]AKJ63825.1 Metallo-beta-lactamase superfamily protein [Kiritimatiella glycovorans]
MMNTIRMTVVVDNTTAREDLKTEHGLSVWFEGGDHPVLFDTGQGDALKGNAAALNIDLAAAQSVVLSHGHADHTGGLSHALKRARGAQVYMHPDALAPKFSLRGGTPHNIGLPESARRALMDNGANWISTMRPRKVAPGIYATGQIPRETGFEASDGVFFHDAAGQRMDRVLDDQALFAVTPEGLIVLMGCAHAGVINTLRYVRRITGNKPVLGAFGGIHLRHAKEDQIDRTMEALGEFEPRYLGFNHCTGDRAAEKIRDAFPDAWIEFNAGSRVEIEVPAGVIGAGA